MSINNFEDFIRSKEFNKVIYEEYDFIEISKNNNTRILKRTNYNLNKLKNIDFPFVLLKLVEDLLDKINLEITVNETYTHNNVNYYCNLKSELEHYKFIEDIYYNHSILDTTLVVGCSSTICSWLICWLSSMILAKHCDICCELLI